MKKLSALLLAAALTATAASADEGQLTSEVDAAPSAGAMAFDLLAVRPLGLVSAVLGTGLFVVQLPLDVFVEGGVRAPFRKLVAEPFKFTFARPLGSNEEP